MAEHFKKIILSAVLSLLIAALTVFYPFFASGSITVNAQTNEGLSAASVSGEELPIQTGVTDDTPEYDIALYQKAAENENSVLYADLRNGYFALKNKISGKVWYSVPNDMLTDEITTGA